MLFGLATTTRRRAWLCSRFFEFWSLPRTLRPRARPKHNLEATRRFPIPPSARASHPSAASPCRYVRHSRVLQTRYRQDRHLSEWGSTTRIPAFFNGAPCAPWQRDLSRLPTLPTHDHRLCRTFPIRHCRRAYRKGSSAPCPRIGWTRHCGITVDGLRLRRRQ